MHTYLPSPDKLTNHPPCCVYRQISDYIYNYNEPFSTLIIMLTLTSSEIKYLARLIDATVKVCFPESFSNLIYVLIKIFLYDMRQPSFKK